MQDVAVNPLNGDRWVLHSGSTSTLWRQTRGTGAFVAVGTLGNNPIAIALDWENREVWVADATDDQVICLDYAGVQQRFVSGANAIDMVDIAYDVKNDLLFIASGTAGARDIFVTPRGSNAPLELVDFITFSNANAIAFDQADGRLYAVSGTGRSVTRIDGAGLTSRGGTSLVGGTGTAAPVGVVFASLAIDEETKDLYAADQATGDVYVNAGANSTWVVTTRAVGADLNGAGLWYSQREGNLYQAIATTNPAATAGRLDVNQGGPINNGIRSYIKT